MKTAEQEDLIEGQHIAIKIPNKIELPGLIYEPFEDSFLMLLCDEPKVYHLAVIEKDGFNTLTVNIGGTISKISGLNAEHLVIPNDSERHAYQAFMMIFEAIKAKHTKPDDVSNAIYENELLALTISEFKKPNANLIINPIKEYMQKHRDDFDSKDEKKAAIQKVVDEFLENFLITIKQFEESDYGHFESFHLHYTLADTILKSKAHQRNFNIDRMQPLIGMSSFGSRAIEKEFEMNFKDIDEDILFVIKNYDKQEPGDDWFASELTSETKTVIKNKIKSNHKNGKFSIDFVDMPEDVTVVKFKLTNNKSGKSQYVEVTFEDGVYEKTNVFNDKKDHILEITSENIPKLTHYRYIADINGFSSSLDQVLWGIKQYMKENAV